MPVLGAVMAGGRSSRFGQDKALLELNGETLLRRAVRTRR
ncbi:MAG: molybdenum cofactor guanylyltransferase, partial [Dehalococcoidia bacterium]